MGEEQITSGDPEDFGDGPYADHPMLSALPRGVRQRIADQIRRDRRIGAIKTLRDAVGPHLGLKEAKDIIDGLDVADGTRQPGKQAMPMQLASGKIDKGGTTLTLYRDGTFTTTGLIFTSDPDRLIGFSSEIDSMRRKSMTGRGAAAIVTTGLTGAPLSMFASNNRGVIYVTITGEWSGSKTYTTKNPGNNLLSSIRSLQAAADHLLSSASAPATTSEEGSATATQQNSDIATQLKMIAELHASGALSDEEFAAAKTRLLS
ncbi:SHOCT domain-containing protein [Mycobacterium colombiense]|nr:SHOCT domain-containing protein [Mycobacterium colombiense]